MVREVMEAQWAIRLRTAAPTYRNPPIGSGVMVYVKPSAQRGYVK
jgi:hypothetical protein